MAINTKSRDRLGVVADLFDSFHGAQKACSVLKEKNYPEESIFQFVVLTAQDDVEARSMVLKDLGFTARQIEFLDEQLGAGRILVCVDSLTEEQLPRVEVVLRHAGGMDCEELLKNWVSPKRKKTETKKSAMSLEVGVETTETESKVRSVAKTKTKTKKRAAVKSKKQPAEKGSA